MIDPPIPASGKCAVCGKSRQTKRSLQYGKDAAEGDPFCSVNCAREYHGTQLNAIVPGPKKTKP